MEFNEGNCGGALCGGRGHHICNWFCSSAVYRCERFKAGERGGVSLDPPSHFFSSFNRRADTNKNLLFYQKFEISTSLRIGIRSIGIDLVLSLGTWLWIIVPIQTRFFFLHRDPFSSSCLSFPPAVNMYVISFCVNFNEMRAASSLVDILKLL